MTRTAAFEPVGTHPTHQRKGLGKALMAEGLRRVHAILRRQDDDFCDPLELRSDSALGVPGLTDCARRGSVLLANAIGSGVLESGALMGFLPALSERLLGEPLAMPSVATWWLGERADREEDRPVRHDRPDREAVRFDEQVLDLRHWRSSGRRR
jgi:hypothetical protein